MGDRKVLDSKNNLQSYSTSLATVSFDKPHTIPISLSLQLCHFRAVSGVVSDVSLVCQNLQVIVTLNTSLHGLALTGAVCYASLLPAALITFTPRRQG